MSIQALWAFAGRRGQYVPYFPSDHPEATLASSNAENALYLMYFVMASSNLIHRRFSSLDIRDSPSVLGGGGA